MNCNYNSFAGYTKEGCDDGWVAYDRHCYTAVNGPIFGNETSEDVCGYSSVTSQQGILASIWSDEEMAFLSHYLTNLPSVNIN